MNTNVYPVSAIEHQWSFTDATNDAINNNFFNYNISGTLPTTTTNCIDFNYRDKYVDGQTLEYMFQNYAPSTTTHTGGHAGSEIWNSADGEYIYLKIEPSGANQRVSVETVDDIIYTEES